MSPPDARFVEEPLPAYREYPAMEMIERANGLLAEMRRRRTVRDFDSRPVATLTHTPNPMSFLNKLCGRPASEKPVILLVVGYPKQGCQVPVHGGIKKPLDQIAPSL
jgi:hypothetical protein